MTSAPVTPAAGPAPVAPAHASGPAEPTRPPLAAHRPQNTLVSNQDEAADLRRRISLPGTPADDLEMELEEIDDFDHPSDAQVAPGRAPDTTAPELVLQPETASATEVEVPIDIEVAPGTTRISLNIKLLLNLRRS